MFVTEISNTLGSASWSAFLSQLDQWELNVWRFELSSFSQSSKGRCHLPNIEGVTVIINFVLLPQQCCIPQAHTTRFFLCDQCVCTPWLGQATQRLCHPPEMFEIWLCCTYLRGIEQGTLTSQVVKLIACYHSHDQQRGPWPTPHSGVEW